MSHRFKALLKQLITASLYYSGIAWLVCAITLRRRAVVLMYHRVLPAEPPPDSFSADAIVVSTATFERQMRFLKKYFNPVSATELQAMIAGSRRWQPRTCVITFDDGWFDNLNYALPVLERHGVPAILFVATDYVGSANTFWQERLTRLLYRAWRLQEAARPLFQQLQADNLLSLPETTIRAHVRFLVTSLKTRTRKEIEDVIAATEQLLREHEALPAGSGDDRFMSWSDAARLNRGGLFKVASHAHSHTPLTSLPSDTVAGELRESQAILSRHVGEHLPYFAYPNGNHDDRVVELVDQAGLEMAFTTDSGWVAAGDHPLRLKRVNIGERGTDSSAGFLCRILRFM